MKLSDRANAPIQKMLYIGDSGTGKTGSLVSLVRDGYRLRIIDYDNGLSSLAAFVAKECPYKADNVDYVTFRDKYKAGPSGPIVKGQPRAYVDSLKAMERWPTDESDPAEWGHDTVLVIDSMTRMGRAAFEWAKGMNPGAKDPRQWFYSAQQVVENAIALLTSESFFTNVIVISHITLVEFEDGTQRGYPSTIGKAFSKNVGSYFDTLLVAEARGSGANVKREIKTVRTQMVDVKTPAPFALEATYPLGSGMATIFAKLREAAKV